jgi:hypothetical protein|tara:strand:- start:359 stop:829 length:471 start_codon:yes stop_codon:yes gene_type:complete
MSEERKNEKINTHNIETHMGYLVKEDVMKVDFKMEIETKFYFDKTSIASLIVPYIKEQLKKHLKMEATKDLKGYRKAIRTILKRIKEDEKSYGYSDLNIRLFIYSETKEVSDEYYKSIEVSPFHKNNIVRPLTFKEFNISEDNRRRKLTYIDAIEA